MSGWCSWNLLCALILGVSLLLTESLASATVFIPTSAGVTVGLEGDARWMTHPLSTNISADWVRLTSSTRNSIGGFFPSTNISLDHGIRIDFAFRVHNSSRQCQVTDLPAGTASRQNDLCEWIAGGGDGIALVIYDMLDGLDVRNGPSFPPRPHSYNTTNANDRLGYGYGANAGFGEMMKRSIAVHADTHPNMGEEYEDLWGSQVSVYAPPYIDAPICPKVTCRLASCPPTSSEITHHTANFSDTYVHSVSAFILPGIHVDAFSPPHVMSRLGPAYPSIMTPSLLNTTIEDDALSDTFATLLIYVDSPQILRHTVKTKDGVWIMNSPFLPVQSPADHARRIQTLLLNSDFRSSPSDEVVEQIEKFGLLSPLSSDVQSLISQTPVLVVPIRMEQIFGREPNRGSNLRFGLTSATGERFSTHDVLWFAACSLSPSQRLETTESIRSSVAASQPCS